MLRGIKIYGETVAVAAIKIINAHQAKGIFFTTVVILFNGEMPFIATASA
jgi:hypothetical protein